MMKVRRIVQGLLALLVTAGTVFGLSAVPISAAAEETAMTEQTLYITWDRSDRAAVVLATGSSAREMALMKGHTLLAASLKGSPFQIEDGVVTIGTAILDKLPNGLNELTLVALKETIPVALTITDTQAVEPSSCEIKLMADSPVVWDKNDAKGITLTTNSASRKVSLYQENTLLGTDLFRRNLTIEDGQVTIGAALLSRLPIGTHTLSLHLQEGILPFEITVTGEIQQQETSQEDTSLAPQDSKTDQSTVSEVSEADKTEPALVIGATEFRWDKSDDNGLVVQTTTKFGGVSIEDAYHLLSDDLTHQTNLSVENGRITIGADILRSLGVGTHPLTLSMQDGKVSIWVTVTDENESQSSADDTLRAEETNFTWDRSCLLGLSVKTNSQSDHVSLLKDGQTLACEKDSGLSVLLHRVWIGASILYELDDGDNTLTLQFDDGTIDIHVHVTDLKHQTVTAEQTAFTWDKNSGKDISFRTDSQSSSVSVRRSGRLFSTNKAEDITIEQGTVTLKANYLHTLYDGDNKLKLTFTDGTLTVTVKVTGTGTGTSTAVSDGSRGEWSSGYQLSVPDSGKESPHTGDTVPVAGAAVVALIAGGTACLLTRKKTPHP